MKCKYCPSQNELMWGENYKKGNKPLELNGKPHICIETPKNTTQKARWKRVPCPNCSREVIHNVNHPNYDPGGLCTECVEKHEMFDK